MRKSTRERINKTIWSVILGLCGLLLLYPFIYIILGALTTKEQFMNSVLLPIPAPFEPKQLENFVLLFRAEGIWTSLILTVSKIGVGAVMCVLTSTIGGYVFSMLRFKGKHIVFMYFMLSMMIPGVATMVPSFIMMVRFPLVGGNNILGQGGYGFYNNAAIHFILGLVSAYNIFLVRQAMTGIGSEYKEAASIDGAGIFRIMFTIYLPLIFPIIAVMLIGLFIGVWNDYMFSLIYLPGAPSLHTIGTKVIDVIKIFNVSSLNPEPNYPVVFGISITSMLPPVLCYLFFQKLVVSGLTMGGVKG